MADEQQHERLARRLEAPALDVQQEAEGFLVVRRAVARQREPARAFLARDRGRLPGHLVLGCEAGAPLRCDAPRGGEPHATLRAGKTEERGNLSDSKHR
jgi:hypothetical protein